MKSLKITIDWVRHGESCSNVQSGHITDANLYPNRSLGYEKVTENNSSVPRKPIIPPLITYEPNLSYIGIQQAILLGTNYLSQQDKPYDLIFSSPKNRTVQTSLLSLRSDPSETVFVIPFINEMPNFFISSFDKENYPLKSDQIEKMVISFKQWLQDDWIKNFDDIEVMSDLVLIKKKIGPNNDINQLIDQILECKPSKGKIDKRDDLQYQECDNSIRELILDICQKLKNNSDPEIYSVINKLLFLLNPKNLVGPTIDLSVLDHFNNETSYNPEKFYSEIIPYIYSIIKPETSFKILCFSHGNFIKDIANKFYSKNIIKIKNTQVFRETISYDPSTKISTHENFEIQYDPISIRQQFGNFEDLNKNVCQSDYYKKKYLKYKKKYLHLKAGRV
jgi:broad specificity phosphatase PhoE